MSAEAGRQPRAGRGGTLLVVDDEKMVRDYLKMVLAEEGFRVLTATSSGEGLESLEGTKERVPLVILDRTIPGEDSIRMAARFHRRGRGTAVLLTSGFSADEQVEGLVREGWASFLQKPFHPEELLEEVRRLVKPC